MLTDKKNIDQLFQAKLKDYEVTPPALLWNRIEGELTANERARSISRLKVIGIAAAILSAFLAGWWLSNPTDLNETSENMATGTISLKTEETGPATSKQQLTPNSSYLSDKPAQNKVSAVPVNTSGQRYKPSISSMASFAANTSFLNKNLETSLSGTKEAVLFDVEKEFLSRFQNNMKSIKHLSDWFLSLNNDISNKDIIHPKEPDIQSIRQFDTNKVPVFTADSKDETVKKTGNWSLTAGVSPVSVYQRQGGSSIPGQQTSTENSVSGSMLAGYKIGKRIAVKSGIILSQLKQVTRNVDDLSKYPSSEMSLKTARVYTPSGSVNLDRSAGLKSNILLSYDNSSLSGFQQQLEQEFSYIEIPVQVVYKIIDHKFNVGVTGGISTNILTGNNAGLYENGQRINQGETTNIRDMTYSGALGMEFGYDLGSRVTITVQPRIKRFLNSLSSNEAIDFKPYQVDIMTGVTYSFN